MLLTLCSTSSFGISKRSSLSVSSVITGWLVSKAWPAGEPSCAGISACPTTPGFQLTPARTSKLSPLARSSSTFTSSTSMASETSLVASCKRPSMSSLRKARLPNSDNMETCLRSLCASEWQLGTRTSPILHRMNSRRRCRFQGESASVKGQQVQRRDDPSSQDKMYRGRANRSYPARRQRADRSLW